MQERTVASSAVAGEESANQVGGALGSEANVALKPQPIDFQVKEYRNFRAEYALSDDDFIIHYFITKKQIKSCPMQELEHWWLNEFSEKMEALSKEYFDAGSPRIQAAYTPELASWWFRARGYGYLIDPTAFLLEFFEQLDGSFHEAADPPPASTGATGPGPSPSRA